MKAALLSFHNAYNYGAALQAYGLQCAVEQLGADCEYINYVNASRRNAYDMAYQFKSALKNRKLLRALKVALGAPFIEKRGRSFDRFYSHYLRKTEKEYHSSAEAASLNGSYDRFIVGSDQVWNPENNGGDTAFLLDFVKDPKKKVSYSSSFGICDIPDEFKERYERLLSDFSCLAVRESQGVDLVRSLTGRKALLVLDPVFLAGRAEWDRLRKHDAWNHKKKYVFFYTNRSTQVEDFLMSGYDMAGLEKHILSSHVTPADFLDPKTRVCTAMTPERFLNEVADAELVVTASFHCLAFALMYHKKVCVLLTGDYGKDERILSLLDIVGLKDRILGINTTMADIDAAIDYDAVDRKLAPYLDSSFDYLRQAVFEGAYRPAEKEEKSEKYFCEDSRCTGCSACAFACPRHAVEMRADAEGFAVPVRDPEKCVDCGICASVCQVRNGKERRRSEQSFFAAVNKDEIRAKSSSGGCFTAISDHVLHSGGVVCAAVMNDDFRVEHGFAYTEEQRDRMRGTFYVQSSMGACFGKIAELLAQNREVLFVGTPCQVDGLKHAVGENEGLITCDIVCHGVPSPLVFERFIDYLRSRGELRSFSFRDKEYGYKGYTVSATFGGKKIGRKLWLNSFNNLFSHNRINRLSCSSCAYCNYDRPGDLTIGDFWGLEKSHSELQDGKGVSLLIANTEKGRELVSQLDGLTLREVKREDTVQNSLKKPAPASDYRHQVMKTVLSGDYAAAARKYGECNLKGLLKEIVRKALNL